MSVWTRAILAGLLAGALSLTRSNYFLTLIIPLALAFWPKRHGLALGVALLLMAGLYLPWRMNLAKQGIANSNARWWANLEFAGQPGFPSKQEAWADPAGGTPLSPAEYYFGMHTPAQLVEGNVRGAWKMGRNMDLVGYHHGVKRLTGLSLAWVDALFQGLALIGLVLAAFAPGWRWLPMTTVALVLHLPFLYDRGFVEPYRHTYHIFPLVVLAACYALKRIKEANWA